MRCALDVHGVRVAIESACSEALAGVRDDFRYFAAPSAANAPSAAPHVALRLVLEPGPLPAAPARSRFLFRSGGNAVRVAGGVRFVLHHAGTAFTIFDSRSDAAEIHAGSPSVLRATAYLFLLSRIGSRLDRTGRHRAHALALAAGGRAVLCVAGSGVGKTTLGLSIMALRANAAWLADEIPILDRSLAVRPFPLPPRLVAGSPVPWPPPPVPLAPVARSMPPAKVQIGVEAILPRVARAARLAAVFLCERVAGARETRVREAGLALSLPALMRYLVLGRDFPHTKAFWLDLSPRGILSEARVLASRAALAAKILASVPAYSVAMSGDPRESGAAVAAAMEARLGLALGGDGGDGGDVDDFLAGKGERPCSDATDATGIS